MSYKEIPVVRISSYRRAVKDMRVFLADSPNMHLINTSAFFLDGFDIRQMRLKDGIFEICGRDKNFKEISILSVSIGDFGFKASVIIDGQKELLTGNNNGYNNGFYQLIKEWMKAAKKAAKAA